MTLSIAAKIENVFMMTNELGNISGFLSRMVIHRFLCRPAVVFLITMSFIASLALSSCLFGQETKEHSSPKTKKELSIKGKVQELDGERFLTREDDPVKYSATYYYGNADKETVPVLLLHDLGGTRSDFAPLTEMLVHHGYAVLCPDLRGHGKSTKRYETVPPTFELQPIPQRHRVNHRPQGDYVEEVITAPPARKLIDYSADDFQSDDYAQMLHVDTDLFREVLEDFHIEGMINLNRLVVVGVGYGATMAAYMAVQDWRERNSDRFTKTLVLIRPTEFEPNPDIPRLFSNNKWIHDNVAVCLAVSEKNLTSRDVARKIHDALLRKRSAVDKTDVDSKFPFVIFSDEKPISDGTTTEMTLPEILAGKTGRTLYRFIDNRIKSFHHREARWTKLK